MGFSTAEIMELLGVYLWPMLRMGALFLVAPIFGARTVPVRVRVLFIVAMTVMVAPIVGPPPQVDPLSASGFLIIIHEVLIGFALSFALQLMFSTVVVAGQSMANSMGLGFASMADPSSGVTVTILGQFYLIGATLLFLALGGHLVLLELMVESYRLIPIGGGTISSEAMWNLVQWGTQMFAAAVSIALPLMASILVINLSFGVITRAAPQLNVFAIGFPISMTVGFLLLWLLVPNLLPVFENVMVQSFDLMREVLVVGR